MRRRLAFIAVVLEIAALPDRALAQTAVLVFRQPTASTPSLATMGSGATLPGPPGPALALLGTVYVPADNLDPRACAVAGAEMPDGSLVTNGVVRLKFTAAGGAPVNGGPAWVASNEEDNFDWSIVGNAGNDARADRGFATATLPPVDSNPEDIYARMRQNLAPIGTVVDASRYTVDQTATVAIAPRTSCQFTDQAGHSTVLPDNVQIFRGVRMPLGTATFAVAATLAEQRLNNNETIVLSFIVDNVRDLGGPDQHGAGWHLFDGSSNGWRLSLGDSCQVSYLFSEIPGNNSLVGFGRPAPGLNKIVLTRHDGAFHVNLNGIGAVSTLSDSGLDALTGMTLTIDYAWGATTSIVKLGRAMADAEVVAVAAGQTGTSDQQFNSRFGENDDPYGPDSTLLTDSALQWYLDLDHYTGGTPHARAGPAGTAFDFTVSGTPIVRTMTYTWLANPAQYLQDGEVNTYDSRHSTRHSPLQRLRFVVANQYEFAMSTWGMVGEDVDNNDEGAGPTVFLTSGSVTWLPLMASVIAPRGYLQYRNTMWEQRSLGFANQTAWTQLGAGPYTVDQVVADVFLRETTFGSSQYLNRLGLLTQVCETGSCRSTSVLETNFSTPTRLTIVGDGFIGGHLRDLISASPYSGSPCVRIRSALEGTAKVTCEAYNQFSLARAEVWGAGSMEAYARRVVDLSRQGNPSTRKILITLGFTDWIRPDSTAAQAGANLANLLDWLHALDPLVPIVFAKPYCTPALTQANLNGETLQQFSDALVAAASARSWVTVVDLSGPSTIVWDATGAIGFVPHVDTGQQPLADNIRAALGL